MAYDLQRLGSVGLFPLLLHLTCEFIDACLRRAGLGKTSPTCIYVCPKSFKNLSKMVQNRRQNGPKSRSGGGMGGSWSLSGRLGRVLGLPGGVLGRLGHVLGRPGGVLGGILGAS